MVLNFACLIFAQPFFWRVLNLKSQKLVPKKIIPNKLYISCSHLLSATLAASGSSAVPLPGNGKKLSDLHYVHLFLLSFICTGLLLALINLTA